MNDRIIIAADELSYTETLKLAAQIGRMVYAFKIHALYDEHGPSVICALKDAGVDRVWVDAKLHDIPNTVRLRANALFDNGASIISVHASGDAEMMRAAGEGAPGAEIFAVTVLTSLEERMVEWIYGGSILEQVDILGRMAKDAGVAGIVCSPKEIAHLRNSTWLGDTKLVVPGIRSVGVAVNDQKRVGTPRQALADGARHLVIGRQITQSPDPVKALEQIICEIGE